ncbi:MAG: lysyl-tRNA synthetase, partial [Thermomicrobiales bacterium]|nr:lysyl-tRNA synthetase [Thermomicrobiales bacterium]
MTADPTANETSGAELVAVEGASSGDLERALASVARLSELQEIRQAKVEALRDRGVDPYPARTRRGSTVREAKERFSAIESSLPESGEDDAESTVAGRLVSRRHQGKTVFAHVRDGSGELQLYLRRDDVGQEAFEDFLKLYDLGDFL